MKTKADQIKRCSWVPPDKPDYAAYHDQEWGVPVHDDRRLFELLILEGAQAGLSWYTILKRREAYRKTFKGFDPRLVAQMTDRELERILTAGQVICNRSKVFSVRQNARVFGQIQAEFGSFDAYLWRFVDGRTKLNKPRSRSEVRTESAESKALAKDLKARGMIFVGGTIMYAYMQAAGLVNDHTAGCFKYQK